MILKTSLIVVLMALIGVVIVESRSYHKIGSRVTGDRLIINDTLHSPTVSARPMNHTISFRHPVNMIVSCIELFSDGNIYAEFLLNFKNVLHGDITAINVTEFELTLSVYGIDFKNIPENFNSPLTPNTQLRGVLTSNDVEENFYEDEDEDDQYEDSEEEVGAEIIAIGERQVGDRLLFSDFLSSETTEYPANHSVTFRFIDDNFLTFAKFKTFDKQHATAIFSHISDHSIKAVIHDTNTKSLDVQCSIYGFDPEDRPIEYTPLIKISEPEFLEQVTSTGSYVLFSNVYLSILCGLMVFLR